MTSGAGLSRSRCRRTLPQRPARLGTGWGESAIGVYRREARDGRDVLGEVLDRPIDTSVGVIRVDDLEGKPIAVVFRYSAHPVTVGSRSQVASADYPGPAREVLERNLGGLALFLQGCGGNVNPRVGIGYEVDCRDTKNRVGLELGGEALRVAAQIRTNTRAGERRPLGNVPNILFTPWEPVEDGPTCTHLAAAETTVALDYDELPSLDRAREILAHWERLRKSGRQATRSSGSSARRRSTSSGHESSSPRSRRAPDPPASHPGDPRQRRRLRGAEHGGVLGDGRGDSGRLAVADTFALGYTNGCFGYLPRGEDYPDGGWKLDEAYAVPDLIPQAWGMPVILHPDSAQRAVEASLELIASL